MSREEALHEGLDLVGTTLLAQVASQAVCSDASIIVERGRLIGVRIGGGGSVGGERAAVECFGFDETRLAVDDDSSVQQHVCIASASGGAEETMDVGSSAQVIFGTG